MYCTELPAELQQNPCLYDVLARNVSQRRHRTDLVAHLGYRTFTSRWSHGVKPESCTMDACAVEMQPYLQSANKVFVFLLGQRSRRSSAGFSRVALCIQLDSSSSLRMRSPSTGSNGHGERGCRRQHAGIRRSRNRHPNGNMPIRPLADPASNHELFHFKRCYSE